MVNQGNKYFNDVRKSASLIGRNAQPKTRIVANKSVVTTGGGVLIAEHLGSLAVGPRRAMKSGFLAVSS